MNTIQIFILGATIVFFLLWQAFIIVKLDENKNEFSSLISLPPFFFGIAVGLLAFINYLPLLINDFNDQMYKNVLSFLALYLFICLMIFAISASIYYFNILISGWMVVLYIYYLFVDGKSNVLDNSGLMEWGVSYIIESPNLTTINIFSLVFISISLLHNILLSISKK